MNNFLKDFSLLVRLDIEDEEVTEDVSEEDSEEVNFCLSIISFDRFLRWVGTRW